MGTRVFLEGGEHYSLLDIIAANGGRVTDDGFIQSHSDGPKAPLRWTYSDHLPKPEDFILARSDVTLEEIYAAGEWEQIGTHMPAPEGMLGLNTNYASTLLQPSKAGTKYPAFLCESS